MIKLLRPSLLFLLVLLSTACVLIADYEQDEGAKISRLGPLRVETATLRLSGFSPDYRRLGLDGAVLRQDLAGRLRRAGIELLDMQQAIARPQAVLIDVVLVAKRNTTTGIYSYAASVKVWDKLALAGDDGSRFTSVPVWQDGLNGIFQDSDISKLRALYVRLIDRFIKDNGRR